MFQSDYNNAASTTGDNKMRDMKLQEGLLIHLGWYPEKGEEKQVLRIGDAIVTSVKGRQKLSILQVRT